MNRIQAFGILLIVLSMPAFAVGGFILGWPAFAGGGLMYLLFRKPKAKQEVETVEVEDEEV